MSRRRLALLLPLIALLTMAQGPRDSMVGTWDFTTFISAEEFRANATSLADGIEIEMAMIGSQTYRDDGTYVSDVDVTLTIVTEDGRLPLHFNTTDQGTWQLEGDLITEVLEEGTLTPIDDNTKAFLADVPAIAEGLRPSPGQKTESRLVSISPVEMTTRLENAETSIVFTRSP
ncbi:MAG: hypothetical protein AAGD38_19915 [Acidobacteriota bacterium]